MLDDTGIPNMSSPQFFNLFQCFGCKISHFPTAIYSDITVIDTVVIIVSKQAGEHLIDYHFLFVAHVYIKFISTLLFFFPAGSGKRLQSRESHLIYHVHRSAMAFQDEDAHKYFGKIHHNYRGYRDISG